MRLAPLAAALSAATLAVTAAPAQAGAEDYTGGALARELAAGGHHFSQTFDGQSFPDYGLTLDAVLALDATGVGQAEAERATAYVADNIYSYAGAWPEAYAGATGKALVTARAQGLGNTLGGLDLVKRLRTIEKANGRFSDKSQYGDYSNTFGQSFALVGLRMAGVAHTDASATYLKLQQCPGGGFRVEMADTACRNDDQADADATGIALQGLISTRWNKWRPARVQAAATWLAQQQNPDGSITGSEGTGNTNTTGLAVLGLQAGGRADEARDAQYFLARTRYGCSFPTAVRGLVSYDAATKQAALAEGEAKTVSDQDRRASVQAALGLAGVQLPKLTATGARDVEPQLPC